MMLTIGVMRYHLAESEDPSRILDDVLEAARAGAGILRFSTSDNAQLTAVVTPYTPVVVSEQGTVGTAVAERADEVGAAQVDDFWL